MNLSPFITASLLLPLQYIEDVMFVIFALLNIIWSTLYLESWKRRSAEYAYKWGTLDKEDELLVEPRPLFTVSNEMILYIVFSV